MVFIGSVFVPFFIGCLYIVPLHTTWDRVKLKAKTFMVFIGSVFVPFFIGCLYIVPLHTTWGRVKLKAKTERKHRCVEL